MIFPLHLTHYPEKALRKTRYKSPLHHPIQQPPNRNGLYEVIVEHTRRVGLHDASSPDLEDHFTPHCYHHWFTTHMRRAGMPREHIKELRGDVRGEAMDIYYHIDSEELRKSYLAYMPKLGIY